MDDLTCGKCSDPVEIDGDYPKVSAWCYTCNDYAKGVNCEEIAFEQMVDEADMLRKEAKENGP